MEDLVRVFKNNEHDIVKFLILSHTYGQVN